MLQLVQCILKLAHQFPCKVGSSFRQTRGLQIGDGADLVPACLHGDLWKVPPGTGRFRVFVLDGGVLFFVGKAVSDEPWEMVVLDQAHQIEVKVSAVSGGSFRMKDECPSQLQLFSDDTGDTFRRELAPASYEVF